MKKLIIALLICFPWSGCISVTNPIYGSLKMAPGVRVYKSKSLTIINVTYKAGTEAPSYLEIAKIIKEAMKDVRTPEAD